MKKFRCERGCIEGNFKPCVFTEQEMDDIAMRGNVDICPCGYCPKFVEVRNNE